MWPSKDYFFSLIVNQITFNWEGRFCFILQATKSELCDSLLYNFFTR